MYTPQHNPSKFAPRPFHYPKGGAKDLDTYSKARLEKIEGEIKVMEGELSALEETLSVEKRALEDAKVREAFQIKVATTLKFFS